MIDGLELLIPGGLSDVQKMKEDDAIMSKLVLCY